MAEKETASTHQDADDQRSASSETEQVSGAAPTVVTSISQTPDGRWQSTLTVSLQVTSTWGEAAASVEGPTQRRPDDPTDDDGTKAGIGFQERPDDPPPNDDSKAGIGIQKRSGASQE